MYFDNDNNISRRGQLKLIVFYHVVPFFSFRNYNALRIGNVNEMTVRVMVENKAQDAAYPGEVIVTYPSIIDYASSQVGLNMWRRKITES